MTTTQTNAVALRKILEEIAITDLAYKQRDLAVKALELLAATPSREAPAGEAVARTYVIMVLPGMVPVVKGPLADKKQVEDMLRELYKLHVDAQCMVIDMPNTSWPQSGIEWIDMFGDKRRVAIREFLAAARSSATVKGE